MMPPISGMQAMAAATFEGKPVDWDFAPVSGSGLGGGGGGDVGWFGSSGSCMAYIRKFGDTLSRNIPRVCFALGFYISAKTINVLWYRVNPMTNDLARGI